jgi:hypothetical protein
VNPVPKIAAVVTTCFKYSHAQHIIDRLLDGYGWSGAYHAPPLDLVSLYVDQVGPDDLSRERAQRHPALRVCPTIADALTLGGAKLAVDGVVIVAEHGHYPKNEKGQTQYPRYQFFEQVVDVFRTSGSSVPVFNDKHLSWNWGWAKKMYETSRELGFPLQAGSSLPVTWRIPAVEMPLGVNLREAICVGYGGVDSYDFHALEAMQCMVERRKNAESGVRWVEAYRGERFWQALDQGVWSQDLMRAALCRSLTLVSPDPSLFDLLPTSQDLRTLAADPVAYTYEHNDGLRCTMLLLSGVLRDFNFAARFADAPTIFSTQMYLPMPDNRTTLASFFSPLCFQMERMFLDGKPPIPIERTLLTTGLTAAGVESLYRGQTRVQTPNLAVRYQPNPESTFERA